MTTAAYHQSSPAAPAKWNVPPRTTVVSSTPCYEYFVLVPLGTTCPRITDTMDLLQSLPLDTMANDPDLEWLMIDGSYVKAHQHGAGQSSGEAHKRACSVPNIEADYQTPPGGGLLTERRFGCWLRREWWRIVPRR